MLKIFFFVLIICSYQKLYSQNTEKDLENISIPEANCISVDELSSYIKENFTTNTTRIHAIYNWTANHIGYDVNRLQEIKTNLHNPPQTLPDILKTRLAVCQGYADLFTALCRNVGINAIVVSGYVKANGKIMPIAHAWVAAELNEEWVLFDPTWGAGYVSNDKFVKHFNGKYYALSAGDFIADHMPFDPLFQFLPYSISNRQFTDGTAPDKKIMFNYKDSLLLYEHLSLNAQMEAELRRMEGAGIENDLLQKRREYLKTGLQSFTSKNAFDGANLNFSKAVVLLNKYFSFKNKQFTTLSDTDLLQALDSMKQYAITARSLLSAALAQNDEQKLAKTNTLANIDRYWTQLNLEEQFIQEYIKTDKPRRMHLFMKRP